MNRFVRVGAAAAAVLSISALTTPLAHAGTGTVGGYHGDNGKVRVCVQGLRGGDAEVSVGWRTRTIESGDCRTFRGLERGRVYRVVADAENGCRIFRDEQYVRASRDPRTVVFYGRCFDRFRDFDDDRRDR